nr:hypothetical protein Itr_chr14CG10160 [Ipomoea trifida]
MINLRFPLTRRNILENLTFAACTKAKNVSTLNYYNSTKDDDEREKETDEKETDESAAATPPPRRSATTPATTRRRLTRQRCGGEAIVAALRVEGSGAAFGDSGPLSRESGVPGVESGLLVDVVLSMGVAEASSRDFGLFVE